MTFPSTVVIALEQHFNKEKNFGLTVNADALTANGQFREEFQAGAYLVDGGSNSPYKLVCYKSS